MTSNSTLLKADKRTITGKKVKQLRRENIVPANIYGKKIKSAAIQIAEKDLESVYKEAGETGLVEITVGSEKKPHHTLIHNLQTHPVTGALLHADFHEVSLTEKMTVEVPVKLVNESPAAEKNIGVLIHIANELEVEALPTELPDEIEVDISGLAEVDDLIKVSDLKKSGKFTILNDAETVIVRINPLEKIEEPEIPVPAEGEEATEGEETAETPEGEEATEGEKSEGGEKPAESDQTPKEEKKD